MISLILSGAILANSYQISAQRYANSFPECGASIEFHQTLPESLDGMVYHDDPNTIYINYSTVKRKLLQDIVAHECGHVLDYRNGFVSRQGVFGHGPFISRYSKSNEEEDFAEVYKWYVLGLKPSDQKQKMDIIDNLLSQ